MPEPEDDSCSDADGGHEGVIASVIAGVDAPPVFDFAKHIIDPVALAIEHPVKRERDFAVGHRWDAWGDAALDQRAAGSVNRVTENRALLRWNRRPGVGVKRCGHFGHRRGFDLDRFERDWQRRGRCIIR